MAKSILKTLASPFVEFDEPKEDPAEHQTTAKAVSPAPTRTTTIRPAATSIDEDLKTQIMADVDKATPADLLTFYELVQSYTELNMDEPTQYKSALIAFKQKTGKTAAALIDAMKARKDAVEKAADDFESECQAAKAEIDAARKKADDLTTQIQKLSEQKVKALSEASTSEQTLSGQQSNFMTTVDAIRAELGEQESKLTSYLAATPAPTRTVKKGK
jgi:chromosome segregation ATPase